MSVVITQFVYFRVYICSCRCKTTASIFFVYFIHIGKFATKLKLNISGSKPSLLVIKYYNASSQNTLFILI